MNAARRARRTQTQTQTQPPQPSGNKKALAAMPGPVFRMNGLRDLILQDNWGEAPQFATRGPYSLKIRSALLPRTL